MLARELQADVLILDDATGRRLAEAEGRRVVGLLGLLLHAKSHGVVGAVRPILDDMVAAGFFLDDSLSLHPQPGRGGIIAIIHCELPPLL